jgi:putative membrane protein
MMGDWGMGWFGMIVVLSFWVIVVAGTVYFIRWLVQKTDSRGHSGGGPDSQAIEILKERYARGEITREEFASMKSDLLQ